MLILIALASSVVPPPDVRPLVSLTDYPQWALERQESAAATVEFLVEPDGKISRCELIDSVGSKDLAAYICDILRRKRVGAERDAAGKPAYTLVRTFIKLFQPDTEQGHIVASLQQAPDVTLSVNSLPNSGSEAIVSVNLSVDETGKVTNCGPASPVDNVEIVNAICSVRQQLGTTLEVDAHGKPIPYLTTRKVELTTTPPSPDNSAADPR